MRTVCQGGSGLAFGPFVFEEYVIQIYLLFQFSKQEDGIYLCSYRVFRGA